MRREVGEAVGPPHPAGSKGSPGASPVEGEGEVVGEKGVDLLGPQLVSLRRPSETDPSVSYSLMDFAGLSVAPALHFGYVVLD